MSPTGATMSRGLPVFMQPMGGVVGMARPERSGQAVGEEPEQLADPVKGLLGSINT